jgi:hypothetical protein
MLSSDRSPNIKSEVISIEISTTLTLIVGFLPLKTKALSPSKLLQPFKKIKS